MIQGGTFSGPNSTTLLRSEYENTKVVSLEFYENNKPVSVACTCRLSNIRNVVNGPTLSFNCLVDAIGREIT